MSDDLVAADAPWLAARASKAPDALALDGEKATTFAELAAESDRLARVLRNCGLDAGSRVAVLMSPSRRFVAVVYAVQRIGAIVVPLGLRLTAREAALQLEAVAPAFLISDAVSEAAARAASRACAARDELRIVRCEDLDDLAPWRGPLSAQIDPHAAFTILFTSGTAARPKAVVATNANHYASARGVVSHLRVRPADRWLCCLPMSHVGGLSIPFRSVLAGFGVVLHRSFDPERVGACLEGGRATLVSLVPTMLARLLETTAGRAPRGLRAVVSGGAALAPALVKRAGAAGYPMVASYGLTETASQVTATVLGGTEAEHGNSGRPLAGVKVRILEPDREGIGEILVRAPQVMAGYWGDERATAETLVDGWLHTADAGRLAEDGSLIVVDRRSDLIVSGGENVAPAEVEAVLLEHPALTDAAVFSRPDEIWGQTVCAAVVLKKGERLDAGAIADWCRSRLAGFKIPRRFSFVDSLPRTPSGKLRRGEVAEHTRRSRALPDDE